MTSNPDSPMTQDQARAVEALAAEMKAAAEAREAFEAWYAQDAAASGLTFLPSEIAHLRDGDAYGANRAALNGKWEGWKAAYSSLSTKLVEREQEIADLKNTAPCLYPSAPGETRAGFSSNGVHVEGSQASIKAVTAWNHIYTQREAWSRAIDEAKARATAAEAKLVESEAREGALTSKVRRLSSALVDISVRVGCPGEIVNASQRGQALADVRKMADAALDAALTLKGRS